MNTPDLSALSVLELLSLHSQTLGELRERNVLRSMNNPTGDYAEWLVSEKMGLTLQRNSAKGFDATDNQKQRYQIKGRKLSKENGSTQLGVIRNLTSYEFDFLIAVVFDANWKVLRAAKIAHKLIEKLAIFQVHVNGHVMDFSPTIFNHPGVEDISHALRSY